MQESKESDKSTFNTKTWVIVDGIPDLRENQDYMLISNALEESARMVTSHGSKQDAIVYIPHDKKVSKHSEDLYIDGCALIQFGTEKDANLFAKRYRDTPIVQKLGFFNLSVYTFRDIEKYESLPDQYQKLTPQEFQESRNFLWWLSDEEGKEAFRDQYVIRYRGPEFEETNVFWMDENQTKTGRTLCYDASELKEEQKEMTRQYVQWSPNGLYLLTQHPQGVQIWGGPQWQLLQKLKHERVELMAFSPQETFLITCNEEKYEDSNGQKKQPYLQIWDILTGDLIISVSYKTIGPAIKLKLSGWWPIFKWSHDERYIAKINSSKGMGARAKDLDKINIFKVSEKDQNDQIGDGLPRYKIEKLGGKSLSVDSLFNIEFSPTDNVLGYTTFAQNDDQAKVTLISIPSKNSLRVQTLGFDVKKAHLYWQSQGRYLAINMGHSQSKTSILIKSHTIGIMTVKDKNMPFSRTDKLGIVTNFAWEPDGSRYAVIHGGTKRIEPNVTIFQVQDTMHSVDRGSSRIKLRLQRRRCNQLHWAPKGGRLVICNVDPLRRAGGEIEFIDINKVRGPSDDSHTVKSLLHENMTDIQWDPSGRYLITATTQYLNTTSGDDTRYIVWSYQGEKLFTHKIKYFYQILWRPRPKKIMKLTNTDKQKINTKLTQNGWDKQFKQYDDEQRHQTQNISVRNNLKKLKLYQNRKNALQAKSKEILSKRETLLGIMHSAHYITKTLHERLEKNKVEYVINKDTMKKILNEEIDDFDKWRQSQQQ